MASREEMIAFLRSQQQGGGESSKPSREEMISFLRQSQSQPEEKGIGQKIVENVVEPLATAIDYTYAPIRQVLAAPAKAAKGDILGAITDPLTQLGKHPSKAPTSAQVAEMYGVPKEKKVAPIVQANPLYGSTYEQNPMEDDPENVIVYPSQQAGALIDTAVGGEGINLAGKGINKAAVATKEAAGKIGKFAEKMAVNSTGATGVQASKFSDDAGRQLLDRRIVQFGDNQEKIAERASKAVKFANKQIDRALSKLEKSGVQVDANQIYAKVREKIKDIKGDPSQADIANLLEKELDNLIYATDAAGSTNIGVQASEKIKRGYNRKAGNWADPEKGMVGKEMYRTFRSATEDVARAADPKTAKLFREGKESYGLLAPIKEAAERRANTSNQSPVGGFMDIVTAMGGAAAGDPTLGLGTVVARRAIAPRTASSVAVTADKLSKTLRQTPELAVLEKQNPGMFQAVVQQIMNGESNTAMMKAAENKSSSKGTEKWASDGINNLKKVDAEGILDNPEVLKKIKKNELLFEASKKDVSEKKLKEIFQKIRTSYLNGGE